MSEQQKNKGQQAESQQTIRCRDAGLNCDYEVRDTDEHEVLASAQAHAKRKHSADYSFDQLRGLMHKVHA